MRNLLTLIIGLGIALAGMAVVVFHSELGLSWVDSLYFVVTTITSVGYGDINLQSAPAGLKIFGSLVMLGGTTTLAAAIALISDILFKIRLDKLFGKKKKAMNNHVILCGLGHVGVRIVSTLVKLDEQVLVIDMGTESRLVDEVRGIGVGVLIEDIRNPKALERANIKYAKSVVAASDDDLANLEIALNARTLVPGIRVILPMFDAGLAAKVGAGFGIKETFSTSALSAPALALAALEPGIVGSLPLGDDLILSMEVLVCKGSKLDGINSTELKKNVRLAVICHESAGRGVRQFHPTDDFFRRPAAPSRS